MKTKNKTKRVFGISRGKKHTAFFYREVHDAISLIILLAITALSVYFFLPKVEAAGIDDVTVTLGDAAVSAENQITVDFTPVTAFTAATTVSIYLGEATTGDEFTDGDADQSASDIDCVQSGTTFNNGAFTDATATAPMLYYIEVNTVGAGNGAVTCTLGSSGTDGPSNPGVADGHSVFVATTDDAGAGIAYVGDANDVTVSVAMLYNLALTIDNADGTRCTTASGVTSCNLGVVLTTTVGSGNYDVNVGTNAVSGATLQIDSDGAIRNDAESIAAYVEDSGAITAGTEEYGIDVAADAAWAAAGDFSDDASPVPETATTLATTTAEINIAADDITITHKAAIDSTVQPLTYAHIVTWTAIANF